ncbi:uncharacterized protein IL334_007902 [Kwoniella shivajii]|uniref:NADH dehydrogenase [ubiquinone] iron-sulfur protein 4, mitochondrial n=1 Tax=Kwoniella shivajii TaxID=564305 RepID=A0ABZ1DAU7_9TREE|nr:hypothetical protein IL334_007902 [Kwoniella shivajii]
MFASRSLLRSSALPRSSSRALHTSKPILNTNTKNEKHVDGSSTPVLANEPGLNAPAELQFPNAPQVETVSGAPTELLHRAVRIYRPTKSTMQSAKGKTKRWLIDWDVLQGSGRWENPLMGWAASADYMQGTNLIFPSKEAAVRYAEKQGWPYRIDEPKKVIIPPKNYANNYVHVPGKLRIHHTK